MPNAASAPLSGRTEGSDCSICTRNNLELIIAHEVPRLQNDIWDLMSVVSYRSHTSYITADECRCTRYLLTPHVTSHLTLYWYHHSLTRVDLFVSSLFVQGETIWPYGWSGSDNEAKTEKRKKGIIRPLQWLSVEWISHSCSRDELHTQV